MTGLKVVDDTTFTIETSEKVSNLPVRLGYTAFAPMPEVFFEDPEAFGTRDRPVRRSVQDREFTENKQIVLERTPSTPVTPAASRTRSRSGSTPTRRRLRRRGRAATSTSSTTSRPTTTDDAWLCDFQDRGTSREQGVIQMMGMNPTVDPRLENPDLRKAISMAIDRATITEQIFAGSATPATGGCPRSWTATARTSAVTNCAYDPEAAKAMWDEAGGIEGDLTLTYNADADHGPWTEAVVQLDPAGARTSSARRPRRSTSPPSSPTSARSKVDGLFRQGWQMDYPSIENFLVPLYAKGAASNYYDYDNARVPGADQAGRRGGRRWKRPTPVYQQAELRPRGGHAGHPAVVHDRPRGLVRPGRERRRSTPSAFRVYAEITIEVNTGAVG